MTSITKKIDCVIMALPEVGIGHNDILSLLWHHNGHDGISNHQPHDCLLNRLFRSRSKKTSKLHVTGLCVGNSLGTSEFPAQMANNAEFDDIIMLAVRYAFHIPPNALTCTWWLNVFSDYTYFPYINHQLHVCSWKKYISTRHDD